MISTALFTSATDEWPTPRAFFAKLDRRYHFTLDPCATPDNATCPTFFTKEDDGLKQDWGTHRVFCNPPYGRTIGAWARKCFEASQAGALVVLLVPARTCTRWFHDWVQGKAEVKFIRGRLRFGEADTSAPFPSMLAVYSPNRSATTCVRCGNAFVARSDACLAPQARELHRIIRKQLALLYDRDVLADLREAAGSIEPMPAKGLLDPWAVLHSEYAFA